MALVVGAKAKAIDKALSDCQDGGGFDDVIVWPSSSAGGHNDDTVVGGGNNNDPAQGPEEELALDYGYAEPSPRNAGNTGNMPRRSSLSRSNHNKDDPTYRQHRRASIGYSGEMTLVLPNKQVVKKRRSITFSSDDDTVHSIDTYHNDSDADDEILSNKRQLWFRAEEYRHIERNIRRILTSNNSNNGNSDSELRGLEGILGDSKDAVLADRQTAIRSVLEDQQRQKQSGIYDEQSIATEYQYNSMDAQLVATQRAQQDEQDAQAYLAKTKQVHRKMMRQNRRMSC